MAGRIAGRMVGWMVGRMAGWPTGIIMLLSLAGAWARLSLVPYSFILLKQTHQDGYLPHIELT